MRHLSLLTIAAIAWCAPPAVGDDRGLDEAAAAEKLCAVELPRWKVTADGVALDTPTASALRWTNPSAGRVYGNTYVWLNAGRPAAVGCLFHNVQPWGTFNGELAALTGSKLAAKRDGKALWEPEGEWKWTALPGTTPAATAGQRQLQLKALAGEFVVELLDTRNVPRGEDQTPRLLPKPLHRYDAAQTKTLDGGLFAFVVGTDPELLVLLECDTAAAKPEWRFGVARMNRDTIRLKRKGETVWEAAATKDHGPGDTYLFLGLPLPPKGAK